MMREKQPFKKKSPAFGRGSDFKIFLFILQYTSTRPAGQPYHYL